MFVEEEDVDDDEGGADGDGIDFDDFLVVGQLAERSWDSYFFSHNTYAFTFSSCASKASKSRKLGLISSG